MSAVLKKYRVLSPLVVGEGTATRTLWPGEIFELEEGIASSTPWALGEVTGDLAAIADKDMAELRAELAELRGKIARLERELEEANAALVRAQRGPAPSGRGKRR